MPDKDDAEDVDRRARAYQRARSEYEKTRSAIRSTGQAIKFLEDSVSKYADAAKSGNIVVQDILERTIRQVRDDYPRAWKKLGDSAKQYNDIAAGLFSNQSKGISMMEDRLNRTSSAMSHLLGLSRQQAKEAVAGFAGRGQLYNKEQELISLREDMKLRRALRREGMDTSQVEERISVRRAKMRTDADAAGRKTIATSLQMKAVAERASTGLTNALSRDAGAFGKLAQKATDSTGVVGTAMKSILRQETLAASGVATGGVAGAMGGGASLAIGTLAKAIGPLSAALTGAALVGRVITGIFQAFGETMDVAAGQARGLAMSTGRSFTTFNEDLFASKTAIREFGGATSGMGMMVDSVFMKDIVPAAQAAILTFNTLDRNSRQEMDAWTGTLANVAVQGHVMGFSYQQSMGMLVKATDAFGGSADKGKKSFQDWIGAARLARMTADQLEQSLGGLEDWGRRFGALGQTEFMADFAGRLHLAGIDSVHQKMMFAGAISNMSRDAGRLIGVSMAGGGGGIDAYVKAIRGGPGALLNYTMQAQSGLMRGAAAKIDGMSPLDAITRGTGEQAFRGAMLMGGTLGVDHQAMLDPSTAKRFDTLLRGATTEEGRDALEKAKTELTRDFTQEGFKSIVKQEGHMVTLLNSVNRIGHLIESALERGALKTMFGGPIMSVRASTDELQSKMEIGPSHTR
jgi:hypothetical protein